MKTGSKISLPLKPLNFASDAVLNVLLETIPSPNTKSSRIP
jgi:hypothetical protein